MNSRMITMIVVILVLGVVAFFLGRFVVFAETVEEKQARLEEELQEVEKQIETQRQIVGMKRQERQGIERDVDILTAQIRESELQIESKNLIINNLTGDIQEKELTIQQLDEKMERQRQSLAQLIRRRREISSLSLVEMLLGGENLSDFVEVIDTYDAVEEGLNDSFITIRDIQAEKEVEKEILDSKRADEQDALAVIREEKQVIEIKEDEKQDLLNIAKSQELTYQQILAEREARAAAIRSALFALRDTGAIPFGEALDHAEFASSKTNVRPALILAILQQESNLGENVGTCNRPGDALKWRDIMPGPGESWRDDQAAFLRITDKLGISPEGQPLSCPYGGGWGGAMGPSQFIPTTWERYEAAISSAVGDSPVNPWNPRHAIMATSLYLRDLGAGAQTYSAERSAACRYYSGRDCGLSTLDNTFYGNGVMAKAQNIQLTMIDPLKGL